MSICEQRWGQKDAFLQRSQWTSAECAVDSTTFTAALLTPRTIFGKIPAMFDYQLLVLGAGSGGVRAARLAAQHGLRVGIVERSRLGGTCVNLGCVPKKLYTYAAAFAEDNCLAQAYGWATPTDVFFDWARLQRNVQGELQRLNGIYAQVLANSGAEVLEGTAQFVDEHTVSVDGKRVSAEKILLACGSAPTKPSIAGAELFAVSDDFFAWDSAPQSLLVYGGGYIGLELAAICARLGVETHLVVRRDLPLSGFDDDIRARVAEELPKCGLHIHFGRSITELEAVAGGARARLSDGTSIACSRALAATGRRPLTEPLRLASPKYENLAVWSAWKAKIRLARDQIGYLSCWKETIQFLKPITWVIARGIQKARSMQVSKLKSRNTGASNNFVGSENNGTTDSILVGVLSAPVQRCSKHLCSFQTSVLRTLPRIIPHPKPPRTVMDSANTAHVVPKTIPAFSNFLCLRLLFCPRCRGTVDPPWRPSVQVSPGCLCASASPASASGCICTCSLDHQRGFSVVITKQKKQHSTKFTIMKTLNLTWSNIIFHNTLGSYNILQSHHFWVPLGCFVNLAPLWSPFGRRLLFGRCRLFRFRGCRGRRTLAWWLARRFHETWLAGKSTIHEVLMVENHL